jgi:homocysteine S-methyltransferase
VIFPPNPLQRFLDYQGVLVLDGGFATELERGGAVLDSPLWSAKLISDDPGAIAEVHRAFLEAGADCIATATYQASFEGFANMGVGRSEAERLILESVALAAGAVYEFWAIDENRVDRLRPLVAASLGPYGSFLADGSEYDGRYGVGRDVLERFHRDRLRVMASSVADLIAFETIPSFAEVEVILGILDDTPGVWAWLSFSCQDGKHLNDGTPIRDAVAVCAKADRIAAVGVNCTPPRFMPELISEIRAETNLPVAIYPNSGEMYDAVSKTWISGSPGAEVVGAGIGDGKPGGNDGRQALGTGDGWGEAAAEWVEAGASLVGGCCRVTASDISNVRRRVVSLV